MSYYINPILQQQTGQQFPLPGPGGYDFVKAHFYPEWITAEGPTHWAEMHWMSPSTLGIDFSSFTQMIAQAFGDLQQGGHPIAWRLYHRDFFDVHVPEQICTPDWIPWIGIECIPIPSPIGGANLITAEGWALQILYQGSPPAIALTGSLTLILLVLGIFAIVFLASTGEINLDPNLTHLIEQATPGGAAGEITKVFLVAAIAFGVIAFVLPNISQPTLGTTIKTGPVTTQLGLGRPAPQPARRR
ncbi:hypothetical protein [Nocardioides sp.]|uniref:hypothetical protein n=1 Tax=Nocardioides sp. TaxID=35761 RepID=UPI0027361AA1|nr:hypothetical protein [Nocardioides sp.]MDP3893909.1 hypothetical protein [Nocardioides sp.]